MSYVRCVFACACMRAPIFLSMYLSLHPYHERQGQPHSPQMACGARGSTAGSGQGASGARGVGRLPLLITVTACTLRHPSNPRSLFSAYTVCIFRHGAMPGSVPRDGCIPSCSDCSANRMGPVGRGAGSAEGGYCDGPSGESAPQVSMPAYYFACVACLLKKYKCLCEVGVCSRHGSESQLCPY